jgi:hypothetical protein
MPRGEWPSVNARCHVTSLTLTRNFLSMLSPAALQPLAVSLGSLLLDYNPIACLPLNLRCCTAMTLLSCSHARLSYVPALPPNIMSLRLHDNRLLHLPDDIPSLTRLREARLYNNQISAVFPRINLNPSPSVFGSVLVLRMINNHVTSPLLNTIASGCPLLEELALSHNRISLLHGAICSLARLQRMLLHSNRISLISPDVTGLTSLHTLVLTENRLLHLPPELSACTALRVLSLEGNPLQSPPPMVARRVELVLEYGRACHCRIEKL